MPGTNFGTKRTNADGNVERVYLTDENDNPLLVVGTTVPTSGVYAKGCLFIDSDVGAGTKALYENQGTTSSVSFNLIGDVTQAEIGTNAVGQAELNYEAYSITIANAATSGTALATSGAVLLGQPYVQDAGTYTAVTTAVISGTTLTVNVASASDGTMLVAGVGLLA